MHKGNSNEKQCDHNDYKRNLYFHGKLMTDRDFREEQIYHIEKRKLLNKMLHGWGVVCGLKIEPTTPSPGSSVIIKRGLALDCKGNEIYVPVEYTLNVADIIKIIKSSSSSKFQSGTADECAEIEEGESKKWYVVIKYHEIPTDLAPVYAPGGGCEEKVCEPSRTREGYCIDLLDTKPKCCQPKEIKDPCTSYTDEEDIKKFLCEYFVMPWEECCDDCCDDNYIVLGSITTLMNGSGMEFKPITSDMINNWDCRKYVMTFRLLQYWMNLLAPKKLPFDDLVNYDRIRRDGCDYCKSSVAESAFKEYICPDMNTDVYAQEQKREGKTKRKSTGKK